MDMISFVTNIENLEVEPDAPAKVVIDEVAGVIVMGDDVRISHRGHRPGQPDHLGQREPGGQPARPVQPGPDRASSRSRPSASTRRPAGNSADPGRRRSLKSLVGGLNALGVTPRDMISILQTIKAAGALQADIEVM